MQAIDGKKVFAIHITELGRTGNQKYIKKQQQQHMKQKKYSNKTIIKRQAAR